jgi:hypothetical protein
MKRKIGYWMSGLIVSLLLIYTGAWIAFARWLDSQVDLIAANAASDGAPLHFGSHAVDGFPGAIHMTFNDFSGGNKDGTRVTAPLLELKAWPWALTHVALDMPQGATITVPATVPQTAINTMLQNGNATLDYQFTSPFLALAITFDNVRMNQTINGQPGPLPGLKMGDVSFTLTRPATLPTQPDDIAYSVGMMAHHMTLPNEDPADPSLVAGGIDVFNIHASLKGVPPMHYAEHDLAVWRDGQGTLDVDQLSLNAGTLAISGSGTGALDKALQPEFAASFKISGIPQLLDKLVASGNLPPDQASMARNMLMALSTKQGTDPQNPEIILPISVQNRHVSVMGITVGKMPVVTWPAAGP